MLRVRLFGFVSYVVDDGDEIRLTDLRFPRVLAYLAVHGDAHPTKAAVRNAVWGRVGAEDNLRRTLRDLRDQHPQLATRIHEHGRTIGLDTSARDVDVLTFAGLKQAQRYDEALRLVRGGFMADVPDELCEWVDAERRRWNGQAARVCELLAARDWHDGSHERSIELARQSERLRPAEPAATITLAGYLAASGQSDEALSKLMAFRAQNRTLAQLDSEQLEGAIARLRSGAPLELPRRPALTNGTSPSGETSAGRPDVADDRRAGASVARPTQRAVAQRVCSRADDALCDEYRLRGWVAELARRRELYFAWCDHASRALTQLTGGTEPRAQSLVLTLVGALGEDESFAGHVRARGGVFLTDDANWDKLYRAGAATILEEYLDEVQKGTWP